MQESLKPLFKMRTTSTPMFRLGIFWYPIKKDAFLTKPSPANLRSTSADRGIIRIVSKAEVLRSSLPLREGVISMMFFCEKLHVLDRLEIFVLRPECGVIGFGSGEDDAVGHSEFMINA